MGARGPAPKPPGERIAKLVKVDETTGCWEWQGLLNSNGYGLFRLGPKLVLAHRASYAIWNGEIPEGQVVRHKCDNRKCVRPTHLELGSASENMRDALDRGRWNGRGVRYSERPGNQ